MFDIEYIIPKAENIYK